MQEIFKNFFLGKISVQEFETFLYIGNDLEYLIGKEVYSDLISFNFQQEHAYHELTEYLKNKVIPTEKSTYWNVRRILSRHGWYEGRLFDLDSYKTIDTKSQRIGEEILKEFGGLEIDSNPEYGDISFFTSPSISVSSKLGRLCYFASVSRTYASICVARDGKFYRFVDMLGSLYFLGNNFDSAIENVLLRKELGDLIEGNGNV